MNDTLPMTRDPQWLALQPLRAGLRSVWSALRRSSPLWLFMFILFPLLAPAQSQPWLFDVTFRGMSYQTNANGDVTKISMSETTILQELAAPVGITDLSTLALVYHVNEGVFGDAITVVNPNNGAKLDKLWGFYFGSDLSLGRMAVTNAFGTMERRVDQLYTKQSQFALGSAFITKRHVADAQGNVRTTIDGDLHYLVLPQGTNPSPRLCIGTFTTTRPFRPRQ